MEIMKGKGASKGIAFGRLCFYHHAVEKNLERSFAEDIGSEIQKLELALEIVKERLEALHRQMYETAGAEAAEIFQTHRLMLEDPDFQEMIRIKIEKEGVCAAYAVQNAGQECAELFSACEDAYMRERTADIQDLAAQLICILESGAEKESRTSLIEGDLILAADDLSPSETAQLDLAHIRAFVTEKGTMTSHTAIFARTMGIPAVVALNGVLKKELEGCPAAIDGEAGLLYCTPDETHISMLKGKRAEFLSMRETAEQFRGKETRTAGGKRIKLCANAGGPEEIKQALQNDAEGIGLLRSEFLYLQSKTYPKEEMLYQAYRSALERMQGRQVIIRTLDIGADKQADYFDLAPEENPALGLRAIRICLKRPELFYTQLRAIYRASVYGNAAVMFPMITSLRELQEAKRCASAVREDLRRDKIAFSEHVPIGIMIETPAAAVLSDELALECDFFSVGTNDLTQYTLALDRQNEAVSCFEDPEHRAVLRLIRMAAESAHAAGIWIGICGELGASRELLPEFVRMGIDELSVAASNILPLRAALANL